MTPYTGEDDISFPELRRHLAEVHCWCPGSGRRLAFPYFPTQYRPAVPCPVCERSVSTHNDIMSDHGRVCLVEVAAFEPFDAAKQADARKRVFELLAERERWPNSQAPLQEWKGQPTIVWR